MLWPQGAVAWATLSNQGTLMAVGTRFRSISRSACWSSDLVTWCSRPMASMHLMRNSRSLMNRGSLVLSACIMQTDVAQYSDSETSGLFCCRRQLAPVSAVQEDEALTYAVFI